MPRTIEQGFADFLGKLKATAPESLAAANHRASVEACLRANFGLLRFVRIGSFGNGTSIAGFSDVDYLAAIPRWQLSDSSTYSLAKIRNALDIRFPMSGVRVNTPAVGVYFGVRASETIEVVPANEVGLQRGFKIYQIADGDGRWMHASPDAHNAYVARVDALHSGRVKPLIRFVKAWKFSRDVPISSFYLEMRVARYAEQERGIIYDIDMQRLLGALFDGGLPAMQDPTGCGGYIRACRTDGLRQDALSKLSTVVSRLDKAVAASERGRVAEAFDWLRMVYGSGFPSYYY
jgi:hypothetical protein